MSAFRVLTLSLVCTLLAVLTPATPAHTNALLPRWHLVNVGDTSSGINGPVGDIELLADGRFAVAYVGGIVDLYDADYRRVSRIGGIGTFDLDGAYGLGRAAESFWVATAGNVRSANPTGFLYPGSGVNPVQSLFPAAETAPRPPGHTSGRLSDIVDLGSTVLGLDYFGDAVQFYDELFAEYTTPVLLPEGSRPAAALQVGADVYVSSPSLDTVYSLRNRALHSTWSPALGLQAPGELFELDGKVWVTQSNRTARELLPGGTLGGSLVLDHTTVKYLSSEEVVSAVLAHPNGDLLLGTGSGLRVARPTVPLTFAELPPETATIGEPYQGAVRATGAPRVTSTSYGPCCESLPLGLEWDPSTRSIVGTPEVAGEYPLTFYAQNDVQSISADRTIVVREAGPTEPVTPTVELSRTGAASMDVAVTPDCGQGLQPQYQSGGQWVDHAEGLVAANPTPCGIGVRQRTFTVPTQVGTMWRVVALANQYSAEASSASVQFDPPAPSPVTVLTWSTKQGSSRIGKTASVTATRAEAGALVRYAWRVGTNVVDRDRVVVVKRAWRGKVLSVRIQVTKPGKQAVSRTLTYPRVR